MCIAILNTKGVTLKKELLKNCWENNTDGAGMLYTKDGQMQVFKEMKSFDTFYKEYSRVRKQLTKNNIVLHFRISTHGKVNETNCHPFLVSDALGFVHNGMIYDVPTSKDYSDTYMFNEELLKNLKDGFEYNETMLDMLETFIGSGSKLLFLNSDDDFAIVNEKAGHWNLNCWFSNNSYKQVNNWVDYGGKKVSKSTFGYGSYNTYGYGKTYKPVASSSGTSKSSIDSSLDFYDDWKQEGHQYCDCCDINLYGINEINRGMCEWCYEEQAAIAENREPMDMDVCENCVSHYGKYNSHFQAYVCSDCIDTIDSEEYVTVTNKQGA
jgi:predicted glutamine amidotransferase